jgi:glycosyltransferase involved in cell wall biosynthesis
VNPDVMHISFGPPGIRGGGQAVLSHQLVEWQIEQGYEILYVTTGWRNGARPSLRIGKSLDGKAPEYELWNAGAHSASGQTHLRNDPAALTLIAKLLDGFPSVRLVHIGNLISLPTQTVALLKDRDLRVVMELSDYLPVCPTLYLYRSEERARCEDFEGGAACQACLAGRVSDPSLRVMEMGRSLLGSGPLYATARRVWRRYSSHLPRQSSSAAEFVRRRGEFQSALALADVIVCVSRRQLLTFEVHGMDMSRAIVVNPTLRDLPDRIDRDYRGQSLPCVYIGSLSPQKGARTIVEAFRSIDASEATVDLYGWADGGFERELRDLAAGCPGIRFKGHYTREQLPRILGSALVGIVVPEWEEAFGLTGVEMLSSGLPIIASGLGGTADYARDGDNALLVPPGDARGLGAAVLRLAHNRELLASLARNCRPPAVTFNERCETVQALYEAAL